MKKIVAVIVLAFLVTPAMLSAKRMKIGYVDMQRVLQESKRGQTLMAHLQKEKELKEEDLKMKQQEIKQMKDELDKTGSLLSPDKRKEKEQELLQKMQDFQNLMAQYQAELQQKQNEYTQQAVDEVKDIIAKYAKKHGYDLILLKDVILYMPDKYDITDEIIKEYDKWYQKVKNSK